MKKGLLTVAALALTAGAFAQPPATFHQYWERIGKVVPTEDQVRDIDVSPDGEYLVSINRVTTKIEIIDAKTGLPSMKLSDVSTSGIVASNYKVINGGFSGDGAYFATSLTAVAPRAVYYWPNITSDPVDITGAIVHSNRHGDALAVKGRVDDNTVKVIISGNNAASQPHVYSTTDNGATWNQVQLATAVKAFDIVWDPVDAAFWSTDGTSIVKRNEADGSVISTYNTAGVHAGVQGIALDNRGLLYGVGTQANAFLRVFDKATGALILSDSNVINQGPGAPGGFFNGSCAIDVSYGPNGTPNVYVLSERNGVARYAYGSEVNVPADYGTIDAAIKSYATGGDNHFTTVTMPLIITVDPQGGTAYDEALDMDDSIAGNGDFLGDLILRADDPTSPAVVLLKNGSSDDGLVIWQDVNEVHLENLVLAPSLTAPTFIDDVVRLDENTDNNDFNYISFKNVVITEVDASGDPLVTNKAEAIAGNPATPSSARNSSANSLFQAWGDAGESQNVWMEDVVLYGNKAGTGGNAVSVARFSQDGQAGEKIYINNIVMADAKGTQAGLRFTAATLNGRVYIGGTNAGAGPLSASYMRQSTGWHAIHTSANTGKIFVNNLLSDLGGGRNISGSSTWQLDIDDSVLKTLGNANIVDGFSGNTSAIEWARNTFLAPSNAFFTVSANGTYDVTIKDSVFAGSAAKLAGTGTGENLVLQNVTFATIGPDAVGSIGTYKSATNLRTINPLFASQDSTNENFLDVTNSALATASSTAGPLVGGADYDGGNFAAENSTYQLITGPDASVYDESTTALGVQVSAVDLLEGKTATILAGGLHGAAVGTTAELTNGVWDTNPLTVLAADNAFPTASLSVEYSLTDAQIDAINIFSGHDGDGARGFINVDIEADSGSGYYAVGSYQTGAFKTSGAAPGDSTIGLIQIAKAGGITTAVNKLKFTFWCVSHNSTGYFQAEDDNTSNPPVNYPNQSTILKEIDVVGTENATGMTDWMMLD
jgi:hypothetical protein